MAEGILKFDELKVCTKLAEAYLEKKSEFRSIGFLMDNLDHGCDRYLKKVYYYTSMKDALLNNLPKAIDIDPEKLFALAQKIEENVQLFCQLDYLYREIPINDTKNIDLPLICQSLVYRASFKDAELVMQFTRCTNINESTPLFHLGQMAYCTFPFVICCTPATVAVCTLFVELCKEVGLEDAVYLIIAPEKEAQSEEARRGRGGGCVGVVGARCDVDSAVDAFLAADVPYPWRLRRVLVHEATLERFAGALSRRERGAQSFLLQLGGDERGAVPVEAFRTAREALALLGARAPLAVSVWASDAAEAHELAVGAGAPLAWVNAFGLFRGPPAVAAALYTGEARFEKPDSYAYPGDDVLDAMRQLRAAWLQLAPAVRLRRVREVWQRIHGYPLKYVGLGSDSVVASHERLCLVVRKPAEFACVDLNDFATFVPVLDYVVAGGAALVSLKRFCEDSEREYFESLSGVGAPVKVSDGPVESTRMYYIDAVWTATGTIFAN